MKYAYTAHRKARRFVKYCCFRWNCHSFAWFVKASTHRFHTQPSINIWGHNIFFWNGNLGYQTYRQNIICSMLLWFERICKCRAPMICWYLTPTLRVIFFASVFSANIYKSPILFQLALQDSIIFLLTMDYMRSFSIADNSTRHTIVGSWLQHFANFATYWAGLRPANSSNWLN